MRLFARKVEPEVEAGPEEQIAETRKRRDLLCRATIGLLHCVKELSLDVSEIGSEELKGSLDELARLVRIDDRDVPLDRAVDERQVEILDYSGRMKEYLAEREAELKRIVELLGTGLRSLGDDNADYHRRIYERSTRLEEVSQLDDIRRMRKELAGEVVQLRDTVQKKQKADAQRVDSLEREVANLRVDVEKARNDALVDGLTGAANRLAFDQQIELLVDRNQFAPSPFSLLMLDVDFFKKINDGYGHPVGDRVLIALVQVCRSQIRRGDFLARYGGEEFAILLPDASPRESLKRARLLCKEQAGRQYAVDDRGYISFTISIGVANYRPGDTVPALIARADKALYEAKHGGRNRAVLG